MAEETTFNRFQWSQFDKNGGQVVIRGNDWKQFVLDVESAKSTFLPPEVTTVAQKPIVNTPVEQFETSSQRMVRHMEGGGNEKGWCVLHQVQMVWKLSKEKKNTDGTPKGYWSHAQNGKLCFGN